MKINSDQLATYLQKKNYPVYLISGNEPLLIAEVLDKIRSFVRKQGIEENEKLTVTAQFDWTDFLQKTANFSLFSERKLIELSFLQKINSATSDHLMRYLEKQGEDTILIIITEKLDAAQQKSAWFNLINQRGLSIPIYAPSAQEFPRWIKERLTQAGLFVDQDTLSLLCERTQGNLLAAKQEIEKLLLAFGPGTISFEVLSQQSTEQSQYDVFALIDACLNRSPEKVNKIMMLLQQTGVEAPIILWGIARELRQLIGIQENRQFHGMPLSDACRKLGVWNTRQALVQNYLKARKLDELYSFLQKAASIDRLIKGVQAGDAWQALLELCLALSGVPLNMT